MYFIRTMLIVYMMVLSAEASAQEVFNLTSGHKINADGKVSESEWSDAQSYELRGGGSVSVKSDSGYYYFLVRGLKDGWSHLYVSYNDTVYIFHASAALGTAVYVKNEGGYWEPGRTFSWNLRDTGTSVEAERLRNEFLSREHWLANTNRMGDHNILEYKISRLKFPPSRILTAVVFADNGESVYCWPGKLRDSTVLKDLIWGTTPEKLKFNFSEWAEFRIK